MTGKTKESPRFLVVGVDWMGDVVFSTPLIRALKHNYPDSFIAYSTSSSCADLLKGHPHIDCVLHYDEKPFLFGLPEHWQYLKQVRSLNIHTAIFLHRSVTRALVIAAAGVRRRIGYATPKRRWLLTDPVQPCSVRRHRVDVYLGAAGPLQLTLDNRMVELPGLRETHTGMESSFGKVPIVLIHPGANWDLKRWPSHSFARLIRLLESGNKKVVLIGTQNEKSLCSEILMLSGSKEAKSLAGETTLQDLSDLLKHSSALVSADSGPLHMAAGLGTPIVALFGPTAVSVTGPVTRSPMAVIEGVSGCVVPCYFDKCHRRICMEGIEPVKVFEAVEALTAHRVRP